MTQALLYSFDTTLGIALERRDIIQFETRLMDSISRFISYTGHSISFPRDAKKRVAKWLPEEEKLLLPLMDAYGQNLGVFMASGVQTQHAAAVVENWEAIGHLVVENLRLYKASLCDPSTGLYSRHFLLDGMTKEVERLRSALFTTPLLGKDEREAALGKGLFARGAELPQNASFGVLVIRLTALRDVVREYGYQFTDTLLLALAQHLKSTCPVQAVAARTGDLEFAVHLPAATGKTCHTLAVSIAAALRGVQVFHPLRKEQVGIMPSIGYALYPQNVQGSVFLQTDQEQAQVLLRKARLAAALVQESTGNRQGQQAIMPFGQILLSGGKVLDILPLSRVTVSLGSNMHAREGQRFSIWSTQYPVQGSRSKSGALTPLYKGELVLLEVNENTANAEITHLGDPAWNIEPNDTLTLIEEQTPRQRSENKLPQVDPVTGLLRHADFLTRWVEEREKMPQFCLSLIRIIPRAPLVDEDAPLFANSQIESIMPEVVSICSDLLGTSGVGGRYGLTSLIYYHPGLDGTTAQTIYVKLAQLLEERLAVAVSVGLSPYPFLDYRKGDTLENCVKALEYGMLLPHPHVGLVDSLALNIYADKLFSQGDTFSAIKEYKLALMADADNCMAWNSLGICFASLGKTHEAEGYFLEALKRCPADAMALYNLGYIKQTQSKYEQSRSYYDQCLASDPRNIFAIIRLGQLAEQDGDYDAAKSCYERAATLPDGQSFTLRHFARLCLKENNSTKAREFLHDALIHDPQDAFAMQLLAKLFLDAGEDPEMAASFARQSVSLRPSFKAGWLELARAFEQMGDISQAKLALVKASEL